MTHLHSVTQRLCRPSRNRAVLGWESSIKAGLGGHCNFCKDTFLCKVDDPFIATDLLCLASDKSRKAIKWESIEAILNK